MVRRIVIVAPEFAARLRELRLARTMSFRDFRNVSRAYVHELETGLKRPTPEIARALDAELDAGGALAALVTISTPPPVATPTDRVGSRRRKDPYAGPGVPVAEAADGAPDGSCDANGIDRRALLRTVLTAAAGLPVAAMTLDDLRHLATALEDGRRYVDGEIVQWLKQRLVECANDDGLRGARASLPAVLGVISVIELTSRQVKPAVRRHLLEVGASGAEFAGWLYRDAGLPDLADYWRDRATEWSHEAGDLAMPGYILLKKSQSAWDRRDGLRMLTLAQATQGGPWQLPARVRAEAAQQEARGHAMISGDLDMAERKLDEARTLLGKDAMSSASALSAHYHRSLLGVQGAMCYHAAGQPERAVEQYQRWLSTSVFNRRDYGYFLTLRAQAHADNAQPDAAATAGVEAHGIASATGSVRTLNELRRLQIGLRRWSQRPAVREFDHVLAS